MVRLWELDRRHHVRFTKPRKFNSASSVPARMAATKFSLLRRADQHSGAARISWNLRTSFDVEKHWPSTKTWNRLCRSRCREVLDSNQLQHHLYIDDGLFPCIDGGSYFSDSNAAQWK